MKRRSVALFYSLLTFGFLMLAANHAAAQVEASPAEDDKTLIGSGPSEDETERRIEANAHFAAAVGLETRGDLRAAAQELMQAVEADPSNVDLIDRIGAKLIEWKLPDLALLTANTAADAGNESVGVAVLKGQALLLLERADEALAAFQEALKISPGNPIARRELVGARLRDKDVPGALELVREGAALPSLNADQLTGLIRLYIQCLAVAPNQLEDLTEELRSLVERAETFEALTPEQQIVLVDSLTITGQAERAEARLIELIREAPNTPLAREKLVDLYLRSGKTDEAVAQLERMIEDNPRNPSAHYLLGSIAADSDAFEDAIRYYRKAISIRPEFEPPYYELVGIHLNQRNPREALKLLADARLRFPKRFLTEFYTGIAYASLRRTREALNHMLEAEQLAEKQAPQRLTPFFYFQLGSMLERNGKFQRAEEKFLVALEQQPDDAETLNYLGYMWAEQGKKLKQAGEWIEKALSLDPESAAIQDSMGWVLYQQGKYKKALPYLLNAEAGLDEPDPVILDHLGDAYRAVGKDAEAIEAWEQSLELEFNERILNKLDELRDRLESKS